jgi:hypothetical protein
MLNMQQLKSSCVTDFCRRARATTIKMTLDTVQSHHVHTSLLLRSLDDTHTA